MTNGGSLGLSKEDAEFTMTVLEDAKMFDWGSREEYRKRERLVRRVFVGRLSEVWKVNESRELDTEDEFLMRKGWNQVDSSFRFLGVDNKKTTDRFLKSKGWNDVDSGFRIF